MAPNTADSTDSNPCLSHSATPYGQLLLNNNKWEQITPQIKVSEWVANSKQLRCFQNSLYILQIDLAIRFVFVNLDVKRWRLWYSAWPAAYCHLRCFRSLTRQEVILEPQTLSWIKHCYTAQTSQVEQGPCVLTTAKKRQREPERARVIQGEPERACQDPQVFCSQFIMHKKEREIDLQSVTKRWR